LPFIVVDARGRGNSQGTFRPFLQEPLDSYDAVEWLARQPYCSGKVAMWGSSYLGYVQWAAAKTRAPHLASIVPTAAAYAGIDFPMRNNIFYPYIMQWIAVTNGRTAQTWLFSYSPFWATAFRRWHESGRPFADLDSVLGAPASIFQEWLEHPEPDDYWDACNPTIDDYATLDIPILTITGCYDADQPGALEHYKQHILHAPAAASSQHYLIIGPWDHRGTATPSAEFGGLKCAAESVIDIANLHVEWYAWTMQNGPKPAFLKAPVAYYVMGTECWRYAQTLAEVTARHETYFLDSPGNAREVFASGSLGRAPGKGRPDSYRYDPRETRGPEIEAEERVEAGSLVDQSILFALQGRMLIYHSEPFEYDTEISGFFRLSAWLSIDCPDTDLHVSIYEIGLDGGSVLLSTDAIRARYREGLRAPKLITGTAPLRYEFNRFTFISRQIKRQHRLRLVIAPSGRPMSTRFVQKNHNTGGVVSKESADSARPIWVSLYHDEAHPSALYVPIGHPQ
jgi:putative CocE/NonD family hydrolase